LRETNPTCKSILEHGKKISSDKGTFRPSKDCLQWQCTILKIYKVVVTFFPCTIPKSVGAYFIEGSESFNYHFNDNTEIKSGNVEIRVSIGQHRNGITFGVIN